MPPADGSTAQRQPTSQGNLSARNDSSKVTSKSTAGAVPKAVPNITVSSTPKSASTNKPVAGHDTPADLLTRQYLNENAPSSHTTGTSTLPSTSAFNRGARAESLPLVDAGNRSVHNQMDRVSTAQGTLEAPAPSAVAHASSGNNPFTTPSAPTIVNKSDNALSEGQKSTILRELEETTERNRSLRTTVSVLTFQMIRLIDCIEYGTGKEALEAAQSMNRTLDTLSSQQQEQMRKVSDHQSYLKRSFRVPEEK